MFSLWNRPFYGVSIYTLIFDIDDVDGCVSQETMQMFLFYDSDIASFYNSPPTQA